MGASQPLWVPPAPATSSLYAYMQAVSRDMPKTAGAVHTYPALHAWSVAHYRDFWRHLLRFSGIAYEGSDALVRADDCMPAVDANGRFFPHVRLNFAENLLRRQDNAVALISISEARLPLRLTYAELRQEVARVQSGLRAMGVSVGDRVAGYMPNVAETVVAMLATSSLGAIWTCCSPDFGAQGAVDRFGQIAPKVLFAPNAYSYQGKSFVTLDKCQQIAAAIPSISHVVIVSLSAAAPAAHPDLGDKQVPWDHLPGEPSPSPTFVRLPFNHPQYIVYSSGTTGIPKCIVHGAGGTLLQHYKELSLHSDLRATDNLMYFTTCGWMMWNWMVSALIVGCRVTLFDGSPTYPHAARMWEVAAQEGVTHFGTSAKFLSSSRGSTPRQAFDLSPLRVVLSTGSPLAPEDFDWVYHHVGPVQLSSISGGTDILSCFMLGNPLLPVYRGEIQALGLGMDVVAMDDHDQAVWGGKGELVCRTPFPSMPVAFWDDPKQEKYLQAYFHRRPNVWVHGDYISITGTQQHCGGIVVHGRSDATLKPGGVRIGTAEIYRLVDTMPEVEDSVVIGQPWQGDMRVVLFVRLREGVAWSETLMQDIRRTIRAGATPRHTPAVVLPVEKIPYTRSGKKMELAVLEAVCGREVKNKEAMQDPSALACYMNLPALQP